MKVLNDLYDYGYKIYQNTDYFKFSIDSILLAEFVDFKNDAKVLDMCTGNAPIPLILASKSSNIEIDAVEIQPEIAELAKDSIKENGLENIIKIYNEDIKKFSSKEEYDIITCNPPYFKVEPNTLKNLNPIKSIARHEINLTLKEAIVSAYRLLKSNGMFYIVQRIERFLETCKFLEEKGFGIRKTVFVFTKNARNAEFFLLEASKSKKSDIKITSLYIDNLKTYKNIFREM